MISLASEITDGKGRHARGWLFYDADCEFCTSIATWLRGPMGRRGLAIAPLQDPRVGSLLGLSGAELLQAIRFVHTDGRRYVGSEAVLALAQELWWARPLVWVTRFPGARPVMRLAYRRLALRRKCTAERCTADAVASRC